MAAVVPAREPATNLQNGGRALEHRAQTCWLNPASKRRRWGQVPLTCPESHSGLPAAPCTAHGHRTEWRRKG